MMIWHPFWPAPGHRPGDATLDASSDLPSWVTGPWTPQALAETQLDMWRHAAAATQAWWRYMTVAWPSWPANEAPAPPAAAVPPAASAPRPSLQATGEDAPVRHRRSPTAAAPRQPAQNAAPARSAKRPKRAGRRA